MLTSRPYRRIAIFLLYVTTVVSTIGLSSAFAQPAASAEAVLANVPAIDSLAFAQQPASPYGAWSYQTLKDADGDHLYLVYVPPGYTPSKKYPTVVFLHGAGERGKDGYKPSAVGLGPAIQARATTFPFIAIFPQSDDPSGRLTAGWEAGSGAAKRVLIALDDVEKKFSVDSKRVVLTGWSMGGFGAWSVGAASPERWCAVLPLASGGLPEEAAKLKDVPVWAFHGANDTLVPPARGKAMVDALNNAGGHATFTEIPRTGHDLANAVYNNDAVLKWMLDPKGTPSYTPTSPAATAAYDQVEKSRPFNTAVDLPRAISIRVGNQAMATLAAGAPQMLGSRASLSGRIPDMFDSTTASGRQFSVQFANLSYSGYLEALTVQAVGPNRIRLQLGLRNITFTIGATYVNGARHAAQTGPIGIYIGQRAPVWLTVEVQPFIQNGQIRLQTLGSSFNIPSDNWSVSQPAGVSTQGFMMTEQRVTESLVSGLYGSKGRIENEVVKTAPTIVAQIEQQLQMTNLGEAGDLLAPLWPLPTAAPRVKLYPQDVSVDQNGISLVMGMQAASLDPTPRKITPRVFNDSKLSIATVPAKNELRVGLSPQIFEPLTQLAIDAGLSGLNVLDAPEPSFAELADPKVLAEIIPDLKKLPEGWVANTQFILQKPIEIVVPENGGKHPTIDLVVPDAILAVSMKASLQDEKWQPVADFAMQIHTPTQVALDSTSAGAVITTEYPQEAKVVVAGKFAAGYQAADQTFNNEALSNRFQSSWMKWLKESNIFGSTIADVPVGTVKFRMNALDLSPNEIAAVIGLPAIRLDNRSDAPIRYEIRTPTSGWGGPYTINPGQQHRYESAVPLLYRRIPESGTANAAGDFTLPLGFHAEFHSAKPGEAPALFQKTAK